MSIFRTWSFNDRIAFIKAAHRRTEQRLQAILRNRQQPHDVEVIAL